MESLDAECKISYANFNIGPVPVVGKILKLECSRNDNIGNKEVINKR